MAYSGFQTIDHGRCTRWWYVRVVIVLKTIIIIFPIPRIFSITKCFVAVFHPIFTSNTFPIFNIICFEHMPVVVFLFRLPFGFSFNYRRFPCIVILILYLNRIGDILLFRKPSSVLTYFRLSCGTLLRSTFVPSRTISTPFIEAIFRTLLFFSNQLSVLSTVVLHTSKNDCTPSNFFFFTNVISRRNPRFLSFPYRTGSFTPKTCKRITPFVKHSPQSFLRFSFFLYYR